MKPVHQVTDIRIENDLLSLEIDGKYFEFDINKISTSLAKASRVEREKFEVFPAGYGIHWPLIDEDISIDGLLGVKHKPGWSKN